MAKAGAAGVVPRRLCVTGISHGRVVARRRRRTYMMVCVISRRGILRRLQIMRRRGRVMHRCTVHLTRKQPRWFDDGCREPEPPDSSEETEPGGAVHAGSLQCSMDVEWIR